MRRHARTPVLTTVALLGTSALTVSLLPAPAQAGPRTSRVSGALTASVSHPGGSVAVVGKVKDKGKHRRTVVLEQKVASYTRQAQTPRFGKIRDGRLDKGDMVFVSPATTSAAPAAAPIAPAPKPAAPAGPDAATHWNTIKDSRDIGAFREFLTRFPRSESVCRSVIIFSSAGTAGGCSGSSGARRFSAQAGAVPGNCGGDRG